MWPDFIVKANILIHTFTEVLFRCIFPPIGFFLLKYLINRDGNLEVLKKYPTNGKTTIWIYANHPSNDGFNDLLLKKNNELKAMIRAAHLEDGVNLSINSAMRAALWASLGDTITFEVREISADQADEKKLWPKIEPLLPSYRLFKADRPSSDEDQEAQDPMQHAMKTALEEQSEQLNAIANEVQRKVSEVATNTIQKLREFDPELAATLTPKFKKEPTWEKAFSFSLTGENSIPLNKRGSGIRRLVLFSFFRATTESALFEGKNIIYAVEEPETSQHPDAQRMIVNTFKEMTEKNGCQIIITTHVPGLAALLPLGGNTLKEWVNHNYLQKLNTPEYHIYDSDNTHAHAGICDQINRRSDGSSARETTKREMENYIHSDVVRDLFGVQIEINDTMDVPREISALLQARNPTAYSPETVKRKLNKLGAPRMTMELLHSRDPADEVIGWLRDISKFIQA